MASEIYTTPLLNDSALRIYNRLENVNDSGPNGYNLTNVNTVAFNAAKFNNGADLGASNTNKALIYTTGNIMSVTQPANMTLVCWVKIETEPALNTTMALFDVSTVFSDSAGALTYLSYRDSGGVKQLYSIVQLTTTSPQATYNVDLGTSTLHQIALVKSATTTGILYLDGSQVAIDSGGVGTDRNFANSTNYVALGEDRLAVNFASAIIDDAAVFERVLTPTEISQLYNGWPSKAGGAFLMNFM